MMKSTDLQQLESTANKFCLKLSPESWFELMHWHPDIYGSGNADAEARDFCLRLAKQYLAKAMHDLSNWPKPSQCWCLIDPNDSSQDAIYVHTENPNRSNYPYKFDGIEWDVVAPAWLSTVFPATEYHIGQSAAQADYLYWIILQKAGSAHVNDGIVNPRQM